MPELESKSEETRRWREEALRIVARWIVTERNLIDRLKRKGAYDTAAREVAAELRRDGYIDDRSIAEDIVRKGKQVKHAGRFFLQQELRRKGISDDLAAMVLDEAYPHELEITIAFEFAKRKLKGMRELPREKRMRRLSDSLRRKGYAGDVISQVMKSLELE